MVLVASASGHRHRRAAKSSRQAATPIASPSPSPSPSPTAAKPSDGFSFRWGVQRRLRCSKDGAPVYDSASPSPPQKARTPSPGKEEKPNPPQDTPAGDSSRPQRPRNLRPLRHAASRPEGAAQAVLPSPSAQAQPRRRAFDVALTKEEIARDLAAISRCATSLQAPAARRGKKRPNSVQKEVDQVCPGLLLLDVDLDNYKIEERCQKR